MLVPITYWWSAEAIDALMGYAVKMSKSPTVTVTVLRIVDNAHPDDVVESNKIAGITFL